MPRTSHTVPAPPETDAALRALTRLEAVAGALRVKLVRGDLGATAELTDAAEHALWRLSEASA